MPRRSLWSGRKCSGVSQTADLPVGFEPAGERARERSESRPVGGVVSFVFSPHLKLGQGNRGNTIRQSARQDKCDYSAPIAVPESNHGLPRHGAAATAIDPVIFHNNRSGFYYGTGGLRGPPDGSNWRLV